MRDSDRKRRLDTNQTVRTTAAKLASDFTLDLSLQVGKYDIQKLLGKGATGTVYLAKDQFTGREVALKTIEPEVFRDPEFGTVYRSQFQNEASLAGKLRHPHIIGILDAVVTGHRFGPRTLRWVYLQVLRELAHHCGHADILREQVLHLKR